MTPDEKVAAYLLRCVKDAAGGFTADYTMAPTPESGGLNAMPLWPRDDDWPPEWEHLTACEGTRVQVKDWHYDHTGYCDTCAETAYRADFAVSCHHGKEVPSVTWYCYPEELGGLIGELDWPWEPEE